MANFIINNVSVVSTTDAIISFFKRPHPVFTAIGVGVVGIFVVKNSARFAKFAWRHFLAGPKVELSSLGEYAIVTGSTDGIGKAYAFELAKEGMNLVLISRNYLRLEATAKEITERYPNAKIKLIGADFAAKTGLYERIEAELSGLDVGLLVNNVGTLCEKKVTTQLVDMSRDEISTMISVNVTAAVQMSRIVLPGMIAKRRGAIINMSSAVALFPPVFGLYALTKMFTRQFSHMLRLQFERYGIVVQEVEPLFVDTKMAVDLANRLPGMARLSMVSPQTTARQSLRTLGRCSETCGATLHDAECFFMQCLPDASSMAEKILDV